MPVAQLDRASDSDSEGRGFESRRAYQKNNSGTKCRCYFFIKSRDSNTHSKTRERSRAGVLGATVRGTVASVSRRIPSGIPKIKQALRLALSLCLCPTGHNIVRHEVPTSFCGTAANIVCRTQNDVMLCINDVAFRANDVRLRRNDVTAFAVNVFRFRANVGSAKSFCAFQ